MTHTSRTDCDGYSDWDEGRGQAHDYGADEDAAYDRYRNSPQYAIDKEKWAVLEMMAEALSMPRGSNG